MGQPTLHVRNEMNEGVILWMKSETKPVRDWKRWFVEKGGTRDIRLTSPDRFHVVAEDQQHRQFSAGLVPLKAMIAQNSFGVLDLGELCETASCASQEWSPRERRWILRRREVSVRSAVTFTLHVNGKTYDQIVAPRSK